ncbi:MAG TPA: PrgI family protein [Candidatus Altiarchaeales archaeon]|nr:PrgI family protein [Candidatus Altiarchaeales archaeon]
MPVIPADVKYEERFIGPLTIKQSIYAGVAGAICLYIYIFTDLSFILKIILIFIFGGLGLGFAIGNLDIYLMSFLSFARSKKISSWLSPDAQNLMNIRDIRADTVFTKDGNALAIIKITPINFGMLSRDDQDSVIYGFLEFLNTINFPIQIVMKSVNLDIGDYLSALKRRIEERDDKISLAYYEHFATYMGDFIKETRINDRLFYIVVPGKKHWDERQVLRDLDIRCRNIMSALSFSGITSKRLNTQQLLNLYASYFTETYYIDEEFISAVTMYKKLWKAPESKASGITQEVIS